MSLSILRLSLPLSLSLSLSAHLVAAEEAHDHADDDHHAATEAEVEAEPEAEAEVDAEAEEHDHSEHVHGDPRACIAKGGTALVLTTFSSAECTAGNEMADWTEFSICKDDLHDSTKTLGGCEAPIDPTGIVVDFKAASQRVVSDTCHMTLHEGEGQAWIGYKVLAAYSDNIACGEQTETEADADTDDAEGTGADKGAACGAGASALLLAGAAAVALA